MRTTFLKLHWPVFAVLMSAPTLLLVARRAGNLCFYVLLVLALVAGLCRLQPANKRFYELLKEYWPLHLSMAGLILAICVNQLVLQNFTAKTFDYPSRMAFFVVLLWVALLVPERLMRYFQWAYVAGALLSAVKMYTITNGGTTREYVDFMPLIPFTQMALLLGFFSVLSIGYNEANSVLRRAGIILKLVAGCAGLYAAYMSQTRGAWIGIPVFLIITIVVLVRHVRLHKQFAVFTVLLALVAVTFGSTNIVRNRVQQAQQDIAQYSTKQNPDTSVGIRFQLWKGSWLLFTEHPLVGVGREHFSDAMGNLERRGVITNAARVQPHSHNEILYNMSTLGVFGLLAIFCLYLVPAFYFLREMRHPDQEIRATAGMGLVLCTGFLILGQVDVMLMWGVSDNFYSILAAILFASIIRRKQMLASQ